MLLSNKGPYGLNQIGTQNWEPPIPKTRVKSAYIESIVVLIESRRFESDQSKNMRLRLAVGLVIEAGKIIG